VRRTAGGAVIVAVELRDRPFVAVVADMVEGVVVANGLGGVDATRVRTALWEAVSQLRDLAA
jgi:anti-sigma regulatory factor (Ser/Thr protein kinase)